MNIDLNYVKLVKRVNDVLNLAQDLFDVDLSEVIVDISLRNVALGIAKKQNGRLYLNFNINALENKEAFEYMYQYTVPHEVAHLIEYVKPSLGLNKHNKRWSIVCIKLGGNGKAKHSIKASIISDHYKRDSYEYNVNGDIIELSSIRHKRLQQGTTYLYKKTRILPEMLVAN